MIKIKKKKIKKGLIVFLVVDILILAGTVIYFVGFRGKNSPTKTNTVVVENESSNVKAAKALLADKTFSGGGASFCFFGDGTYAGFFDSDRTKVKDYIYEVTGTENGNTFLTILDRDRKEQIKYVLETNADGIMLTHAQTGTTIALKSQ